jgi:hypothetical protein
MFTREISPHFPAGFPKIFFGQIDIQIRQRTIQTPARMRFRFFFFQKLDKIQNLLFPIRRQNLNFFKNRFFNRHKFLPRAKYFITIYRINFRRIANAAACRGAKIGLAPALFPASAQAQSYYVRKVVDRNGRVRYVRVQKPSYYRRHRNRINMAVGTGAGAVLGGIIGGRRGAAIGAGIGLGSSALYTYKLRPKKRVYKKVRNR